MQSAMIWDDTTRVYGKICPQTNYETVSSLQLFEYETSLEELRNFAVVATQKLLTNIRHVRCRYAEDEKVAAFFSADIFGRLGGVETLVCEYLPESTTKLLADTLQLCAGNLKHLRQIQINTSRPNAHLRALFDAIAQLESFEAIYFNVFNASTEYAELMLDLLSKRHEKMTVVDFFTVSEDFAEAFFTGLPRCRLQQIQRARMSGVTVNDKLLPGVLCILPSVVDLQLALADEKAVLGLSNFFKERRREMLPLRHFNLHVQCSCLPLVVELVRNLKHCTRLHLLGLSGYVNVSVVEDSGLVDAGFLTFFGCSHGAVPEYLQNALNRNRQRHSACRATCLRLVSIGKSKRSSLLQTVGSHVVNVIAKQLYDTRNDEKWDNPQ